MEITMRDFLEAGAHFGHQSRFWNPKMQPYIYGVRQKIHIINLEHTVTMYQEALNLIGKIASKRGQVLFVGTKHAAQQAVAEEATRAGMPYVNHRWLGGMLTNYKTIRQSVKRLRNLEEMQEAGDFERMLKKEALMKTRDLKKLNRSFAGIKNMAGLPDVLFVIDSMHECTAIAEANRLGIPVVAVVDTNGILEGVTSVIPGNDDAIRAIRLYLKGVTDAILDARRAANLPVGPQAADVEEKDGRQRPQKATVISKKADKKLAPLPLEASELVEVRSVELVVEVEAPVAAVPKKKPAPAKSAAVKKPAPAKEEAVKKPVVKKKAAPADLADQTGKVKKKSE